MDKLFYAWWSDEHLYASGYVIYRTPEGKEICCTSVTESPTSATGYKDSKLVGRVLPNSLVASFVRSALDAYEEIYGRIY